MVSITTTAVTGRNCGSATDQHHPQMARALDAGGVHRLLGHIAEAGEIEHHRQAGERPPGNDRQRVKAMR